MATTPANTAAPPDQTQLNIAIDSDLHQQLRLHAVLEKTSLRESCERLLRTALAHKLNGEGQSIAPPAR